MQSLHGEVSPLHSEGASELTQLPVSSSSLGLFLMPKTGLNSRMTEITSQVASCFYLSTQIRTNSESQKILNLKCSLQSYPITFLDKQGILIQADKETVVSIIKNICKIRMSEVSHLNCQTIPCYSLLLNKMNTETTAQAEIS